ncbi:DegT/DnrJ/EryC1/StrS family aminotransferase [Bacilliculturomica massiliensis]|uniref:DegT/DnrJ/EryC1/StrS family aminotransferase n=1 Tax=Bacilliculturomica massiliensis TaxID=1917867 RepID=UPI0010323988|nr:DegT/DnrJ/EryC1/StrS family aminotransferase [Bacilliculturomica massiliensis]
MQFIDLKRQYKALEPAINKAVQEAIESAHFIMGPEVRALEEKLAEYVGRKYCVTCANGTDALRLALAAYDIKKGDAVFVPTFTFYASAEVISLVGAVPVFVDVDPRTYNICPRSLREAIERVKKEEKLRPRAIIAVDLFGLPADYPAIEKLAIEYNLLLIEDGAQGFGGMIGEKRACSFGDIATTSFFPAKPLGCYGDGGAVFTDEEKVKDLLESLKVHGKGQDKYDNVRIGLNSRLDTMQAAILSVKLKAFREYEMKRRQEIAKLYDLLLGGTVDVPHIPEGYVSSYAQYSILLKDEVERDQLQKKLSECSVPSMIYYKKSMHQQTVYRNNSSAYWGFPNAETVSQRILSLPMHPYLTEDEVTYICKLIAEKD